MNQQQRNYLKRRISEILNCKTSEAKAKFVTPGKQLTPLERLDLIRAGLVKLKPEKEIAALNSSYNANYIQYVFDFSKYEYKQAFDNDGFSKVQAALQNKANNLIDRVMLSDAEEAIKMIEEFENFNGNS